MAKPTTDGTRAGSPANGVSSPTGASSKSYSRPIGGFICRSVRAFTHAELITNQPRRERGKTGTHVPQLTPCITLISRNKGAIVAIQLLRRAVWNIHLNGVAASIPKLAHSLRGLGLKASENGYLPLKPTNL